MIAAFQESTSRKKLILLAEYSNVSKLFRVEDLQSLARRLKNEGENLKLVVVREDAKVYQVRHR